MLTSTSRAMRKGQIGMSEQNILRELRDPTNSGEGCKHLVLEAADRIEQLEAQLSAYKKDAERLAFIAECERTVATNKWLVQVIEKTGAYHNAYFDTPPTGKPKVMWPNRLWALRSAIDEAIHSNKDTNHER